MAYKMHLNLGRLLKNEFKLWITGEGFFLTIRSFLKFHMYLNPY